MSKPSSAPLTAFNQVQKENDTNYRNYAKSVGLSDTAFWILYSVAEREMPYTQKELCTSWFFPIQTINSALKALSKQGVIRLETVSGNRKNKWIALTTEGKELVLRVITPLIQAEHRAFERMGKEEYKRFLDMTYRHVALLKEEIDRMTPAEQLNGSSEDFPS